LQLFLFLVSENDRYAYNFIVDAYNFIVDAYNFIVDAYNFIVVVRLSHFADVYSSLDMRRHIITCNR